MFTTKSQASATLESSIDFEHTIEKKSIEKNSFNYEFTNLK